MCPPEADPPLAESVKREGSEDFHAKPRSRKKEIGQNKHVKDELTEVRLRLARMEGAAKRLLDALGCSVDGRKGPDATLDALRAAAEAAVEGKKSVSRLRTTDHRPQTEWKF